MKYRKLRIAWSVPWGVVAVLLCVLWVRSYWWIDALETPYSFQLISLYGTFQVAPINEPVSWQWGSTSIAEAFGELNESVASSFLMFQLERHFILPWWTIVAATGTVAAAPWFRWHFRLRTLLIVTTLIAVVLGIIVWMSR